MISKVAIKPPGGIDPQCGSHVVSMTRLKSKVKVGTSREFGDSIGRLTISIEATLSHSGSVRPKYTSKSSQQIPKKVKNLAI